MKFPKHMNWQHIGHVPFELKQKYSHSNL